MCGCVRGEKRRGGGRGGGGRRPRSQIVVALPSFVILNSQKSFKILPVCDSYLYHGSV